MFSCIRGSVDGKPIQTFSLRYYGPMLHSLEERASSFWGLMNSPDLKVLKIHFVWCAGEFCSHDRVQNRDRYSSSLCISQGCTQHIWWGIFYQGAAQLHHRSEPRSGTPALSSKHAVFSNVCKEQNYTIWVIVSSMSLTNCFYTVITHQLSSAISGYEVIALPGDATPSNIMCISLVLSTFFEDEIQWENLTPI